ncbi:MAG: glycosyltransferase [Acidimicrobiales bacterium]
MSNKKKEESSGKNVTICLNMIVRNEEVIIERCLNSVLGFVDYICICDTGSTDQTVKIIKDWIDKNKIPGEVNTAQWKNFSYNRTLSLNMAKSCFPEATYYLQLDADMKLVVSDNFNKNSLNAHAYMLYQKSPGSEYANYRLLNSKIDWTCKMRTHEYWCEPVEYRNKLTVKTITDPYIYDLGDGGFKSDKFTRDVKLCLEGLEEENLSEEDRLRYCYYLGVSYEGLEDYENSIIYYAKAKDSWPEQAFYARYRIGYCYEFIAWKEIGKDNVIKPEDKIKYFARAIGYYLNAWNFRPNRAETIYRITRIYRICEAYYLAFLFAKIGKDIEFPKQDTLFIESSVYNYLFDYELGIICDYIKEKREFGKIACKNVLRKKDVPEHHRKETEHNLKCYT